MGQVKAKELLLFAPCALRLARKDSRYTLGQHDLLQPFRSRYHVIRAMNVLNPSYFSDEEFSRVLKYIYEGLLSNGLFITGSNHEAGSPVNGGLYKKTSEGFERIWQSGNGSPMKGEIAQFNLIA
jgi:hypothetical protein